MAPREITSLRVLCLRSVGGNKCSAEHTFKPKGDKESTASRLLRSFHGGDHIKRMPCFGKEATRKENANDVDLNHPFIATRDVTSEFGNTALDCLQSYIDSLVELGRLDDSRLGINFWTEWKNTVNTSSRKRKRSEAPQLGALSMHNGTVSEDTIEAMVKSGMGDHVGVLDVTGIHTLTDEMMEKMLKCMPNLQRLSLKNCRRLTGRSLQAVAQNLPNLTTLDIGGTYNMTTAELLEILPDVPKLDEIYAGGLGWSDLTLRQLLDERQWRGIGIGFSNRLTPSGLREALVTQKHLQSLSLPFCEQALDTSLLGFLGRSLPLVRSLDIRGNNGVNSLTSWFDGRSATGEPAQDFFVLARYSNISKASLDETKRIHPIHAAQLTCVLDGGGIGKGIHRE